ncbi:expressed unknown protein [Seminavis robusta]|uniref:BZIP domain-containing protein n=1 Tax=Seminavis robusta TaxID=568900 RepID=A0A9N8DM37_9STRA|nr:expressed unknown protein [Seminavis robusta]|eukprot:Sro160_g072020.1 n/a (558) ;mRNA; r:9543-11402
MDKATGGNDAKYPIFEWTAADATARFAKLLHGDLCDDELHELHDLFLPETNLMTPDHNASLVSSQLALVGSSLALQDEKSMADMNSRHSVPVVPENTCSVSSSGAVEKTVAVLTESICSGDSGTSPRTHQQQMEIKDQNWSDNKRPVETSSFGPDVSLSLPPPPAKRRHVGNGSANPCQSNAEQHMEQVPLPLDGSAQLFGRTINFPIIPAPIAPRPCLTTPVLPPTPKRVKPPTPIAPKGTAETSRNPSGPLTEPSLSGSHPKADSLAPQPLNATIPATNALLSSNALKGIAAPTVNVIPKASQPPSDTPTKQKRRYTRRRDMSKEEASENHRNRNKQHAKNTRLRKKAFEETLKETIINLVEERDTRLNEIRVKAQQKQQNRQIRFQVIEAFLRLRGGVTAEGITASTNQAAGSWAAILDEYVTLSRPSLVNPEKYHETVLEGLSSVMLDPNEACQLMTVLQRGDASLQAPHPWSNQSSIDVAYQCDQSSMVMEGCTCTVQWKGTTHGAMSTLGLPRELNFAGTLRARFNEATNKILSLHLLCDTGNMLYQLNQK